MFRDHPELRRLHLSHGYFWRASHYYILLALVGLVLPGRVTGWLLARPYLADLRRRVIAESGSSLGMPYLALYDAVEMAGVVRGAIRYRTPVL
jgi:hypothetical protein